MEKVMENGAPIIAAKVMERGVPKVMENGELNQAKKMPHKLEATRSRVEMESHHNNQEEEIRTDHPGDRRGGNRRQERKTHCHVSFLAKENATHPLVNFGTHRHASILFLEIVVWEINAR